MGVSSMTRRVSEAASKAAASVDSALLVHVSALEASLEVMRLNLEEVSKDLKKTRDLLSRAKQDGSAAVSAAVATAVSKEQEAWRRERVDLLQQLQAARGKR